MTAHLSGTYPAKSLLVIDDERDIRDLIADSIGPFFAEVFRARDGEEALRWIESKSPDLIITDFDMPMLTGLDLVRHLKERGIDTPVIWLTGRGSRELFRSAWTFGVYDYLEKPVSLTDLEASVTSALAYGKDFNSKRGPNFLRLSGYREVALQLREEAFDRFASLAVERGLSMSELIEDLLMLETGDLESVKT